MANGVQIKIFPRNLTAHADTVVAGNPVVSRPESGADNSHPGLEFDQRTLDRGFFPGLLFDFQFGVGARLVAVQEDWPEMKEAFEGEPAGKDGEGEFFLWYVAGVFGSHPGRLKFDEFYGVDGYEVLRAVHDLEPGPLAIVVGRHPDKLNIDNHQEWMPVIGGLMAQFGPLLSGGLPKELPKIEDPWVPFRDSKGKVQFALFISQRAPYLNADGVIELGTVEAGGLTRSLCSPWQWDFADCGCYYWAASRPDIVAGEKDKPEDPRRNYLRRRKEGPQADQDPPADGAPPADADRRTWEGWMRGVMNGADMIRKWETLPLVINDRENPGAVQLIAIPRQTNFWDRAQVIDELKHLATVEHTLCVKFLYAYYSVNAPVDGPPPGASSWERALSQVAHEVRNIAIDEMRHFRWVNEALVLLDEQPVFGRATKLRTSQPEGETDEPPSLELDGLTREALNDFIEIERPNRKNQPEEVASLYTHILLSLQHGGGDYRNKKGEDVRDQVQELVKLIIDEGRDHYHRALHAQKLLGGDDQAPYLRYTGPPKLCDENDEIRRLQVLGDQYYHSVLQILELAFLAESDQRASMLKQTRRVMHNLDNIGHVLGQHGVGLMFTPPKPRPDADPAKSARAAVLSSSLPLATSVPDILATLRSSQSDEVAKIARQHAQDASELVQFFATQSEEVKDT